MSCYIIASNEKQELICDTGDLDYTPDPIKHHYGVSTRKPIEDWFLYELDFVRVRFPEHEIFTLGATCVFGEKFVTYLTLCEIDMKPGSFEELRIAVKESDQAIRRKVGAMWNWELCLYGRNQAALVIGWLDFAYFVKHRKDFMDVNHNKFMAPFASGRSRSTDYKVLHDGTLSEFDSEKLTGVERQIFDRPSRISFKVRERETPSDTSPLLMV